MGRDFWSIKMREPFIAPYTPSDQMIHDAAIPNTGMGRRSAVCQDCGDVFSHRGNIVYMPAKCDACWHQLAVTIKRCRDPDAFAGQHKPFRKMK